MQGRARNKALLGRVVGKGFDVLKHNPKTNSGKLSFTRKSLARVERSAAGNCEKDRVGDEVEQH